MKTYTIFTQIDEYDDDGDGEHVDLSMSADNEAPPVALGSFGNKEAAIKAAESIRGLFEPRWGKG